MPYPNDLDIVGLFKRCTLIEQDEFFPVGAGQFTQSPSEPPVAVSGGFSHFLAEWRGGYDIFQKNRVPLSEAEAARMLNSLFEYWARNRNNLDVPSAHSAFFIANEYCNRFNSILSILARAVIPNLGESCSDEIKSQLQAFLSEMDSAGLCCGAAQIAAIGISPSRFAEVWKQYKKEFLQGDQSKADSSLLGIVILMWMKADGKTSLNVDDKILIAPIVESIKTRSISTLASTLEYYGFLLEKIPSCINDENLNDVCIGLDILSSESDLNNEISNIPEHDKLLFRIKGMVLASSLYYYFQNNGKEIPNEIQIWKKISL